MRFVVAMMKHETNTFSPVPTPLTRFGGNGPLYGEAARGAFNGTNTPMAAFLALAEDMGAEIVTPLAAEASPSGPVEGGAYQHMVEVICAAVADGCDAVMLDLHGAMVTETTDDGEGTLLQRIAEIAPGVPVAVALDLHANVTQRMVGNATVLVGYRTYPHVDMGTDDAPMRDLVALARREEQAGLLSATIFGGFPLSDIPEAGLSVVAIADGDFSAADAACSRLLETAHACRSDFVYRAKPLAHSITCARELKEGPILLIDHADNCASGGTQDTMTVVAEVMRQGLEDVAVGAIVDPQCVREMFAAGVGARLSLDLGGKVDMPAIGRTGTPLRLTGTVGALTDGAFTVQGPMYTGVRVHMGPSAVFDTGNIAFVVTSRHVEPFDLGIFQSLGIEPTRRRYLLLKSRIHYRAGFLPIARHVIECAGDGVTSSDYGLFRFSKLRRPIYPLDEVVPVPRVSDSPSRAAPSGSR